MMWFIVHAAFLAAFFPESAHADSQDDFANNLFSDLGPVLALFGEKVTMQFMSEAIGWADSIILAMAPIGILTIIVAAIRVAGPLWLKAVVGRARESVAAAEMELMSSTSEEVCELYNGQSIVRCQGKPNIWEFILLFTKRRDGDRPDEPPIVEFKTLRQAWGKDIVDGTVLVPFRCKNTHAGRKRHDTETGRNTNSSEKAKTPARWDIKVIRDITTSAPNITLNSHNNVSRVPVHVTAVFATLLQAGLIVFFGIITYHPDFKGNYLKDEQPVEDSAFPLVASGTALLVLGLFICGHVIEASTAEDRYRPSVDGEIAQIMWIQRGQTVGDQVFRPYATLPKSKRIVITTSRRRVGENQMETSAASHADTEAPCEDGMTQPENFSVAAHVEEKASILDRVGGKWKRNPMRNWVVEHMDEIKTVTGTGVSLLGFIVQFVGLRKMNWAASVAQLAAVLIMVGVRAWIRRGISKPLVHRELAPDSELEWLALVLGGINHDADPCFEFLKPMSSWGQKSKTPGKQAQTDIHTRSWTIDTDINQDVYPLSVASKPGSRMANETPRSRAQSVLEIHRELGKLSNCRGQYFDLAIRLANCMEAAMKLLPASQFKGETALSWFIRAQDGIGDQPQWISFHINRDADSSPWRLAVDEVASALSLWVYSAQQCARKNRTPDTKINSNHLNRNDDTWFRKTGPKSPLGLRALGPGNVIPIEQLIQDLMWWVPDNLDGIIGVREIGRGDPEGRVSTMRVGSSQVVGYPSLHVQHIIGRQCREYDRVFRLSKVDVESRRRRRLEILPEMSEERDSDELWEKSRYPEIDEVEYIEPGTMLAIESYGDLEDLYAKTLLCSFLRSVAKTLDEPLEEQEEVQTRVLPPAETKTRNQAQLWHKSIAELASQIQQNGLGSSLEAHLGIVWSLSLEERLPFPKPVFDSALSKASEFWRCRDLKMARLPYLWLWYQCKCFCASQRPIYAHAIACLIEHLKDIHHQEDIAFVMHKPRNTTGIIHDWIWSILHVESTKNRQVLSRLSLLYAPGRHPWPRNLQPIALTRPGDTIRGEGWKKALKISELHQKVLDRTKKLDYESIQHFGDFLRLRDATGWTPLHYLVSTREADAVYTLRRIRCIPSYQLEIDKKDLRGWTALHYACWYSCRDAVRELIQIGASISCQGFDGASPFHCAIRYDENDKNNDNSNEILETLLHWQKSGVNGGTNSRPQSLLDHNGDAAIHLAVLAGKQRAVEILVDDKDLCDKRGMTPLHIAAACGRVDIAKILINSKADIEAGNWGKGTPLHQAVYSGEVGVAKFLLAVGANLEAKTMSNKTPLHAAVEGENVDMVKLLLDIDADIEAKTSWNETPLYIAVERGSAKMVKLLLEAGANVEVKTMLDETPLHAAVKGGKEKMVKMLLEAGANTMATDKSKKTPLHLASKVEINKLLLAAGATIDEVNITALHQAIYREELKRVKELLEHGADVKALAMRDRPLLPLAVRIGKAELLKTLIEAGADLGAVNEEGENAFEEANREGKVELAQMLWRAGARGSGWAHSSRGMAELM
ncbi:ankyrin 2,3/unc44 [Metarhizium acridum CQMa 102]|uniref:Ankyrin 2,3/unc44 n=1 Tax=Metarhizium acridum (strain CQMa 102) TaxID=655827 RepID=E9EAJ6_METAQ|nr:ankyrin 2,3/unc44 [Metarhizium acridum CQMa 102]EFY87105.1 ankyrin 2,3/unc44 [Metarhizium acridum CQMa 102]